MRTSRIVAATVRALALILLAPLWAAAGDKLQEGWLAVPEELVQELARAAITEATGVENLQIELADHSVWITLDTRYWGAAHRLSMEVALRSARVSAQTVELEVEVLGQPHIQSRNFAGWLSRRAARRALRRLELRQDSPEATNQALYINWPHLRLHFGAHLPWQNLGLGEGLAIDAARLRAGRLELHYAVDTTRLLRWLLPPP